MSEELAEESEEFEYPTLSNANWGVDISQNQPKPIYIYRGETRTCTIYHKQNGQAIDTSDPSATATLLYQTLGMGNAWYEIPCTLSADGVATFVWTPLHDNGADQYLYYLQISVLNYDPEVPEGEVPDLIYRANGNIVMEYAPGIAPNHIPYPITYLDFTVTPYVNAPWVPLANQIDAYSKTDTDALLDSKAPGTHVTDFANPHGVTAAQAGAMAIADGTALANRVTEVEGNVDSIITDSNLEAKLIEQYGTSDIVITNPLAFGFDGLGTITSYDYDLGGAEVVIPYEINGVPVTAIGNWAFSDADLWMGYPITSIIAPKSVTTIGDFAFSGCEKLTSVSFPSVTSIGDSTFSGCVKLTSVSYPSVTTIGDFAFAGCESLTSVSFPSATSISDYAFGGCVKLTSVSFPSATSISDYAFYGCESLTSVFYGSNKPTSTESIYDSSPNVTNYVLTGTSGWGSTFPSTGDYQRPVVMVDDFDYVTKTIYANVVKAKSVIVDGVNVVDSLAAKALKSLPYTELTGTTPSVSPNASYTWTAVDVGSTLTASGFTSGMDESCAIIITMGTGATITGTNITLVDAPETGVNHCFIRSMPNGDVKLYVSYLED